MYDYSEAFSEDIFDLSAKQGSLSKEFYLYDVRLNNELEDEEGRRGRAMTELSEELSTDKFNLLLDLRKKLDVEGGFVEGMSHFKLIISI